jgi:C1A family cysteine protease
MTKLFKIVAFLVSTIVGTCEIISLHKDSQIIEKFKSWIDNYDIKSNNHHHLVHIFNNWLNNDKIIESTNNLNLSYTLGHNHFSGLNSTEFSELMRFKYNRQSLNKSFVNKNISNYNNSNLPSSVDWRIKNVVTPVKDQGQCGSCWAFSSTGSLEGAYAIKYNTLKSFSEQQLVDCDFIKARTGGYNLGCNGGEMDAALEWVGKYGGLCTEESYSYISGTTKTENTCQTSCSKVSTSIVQSVTHVPVNSDISMMSALAQQPVSVAIEADQVSFQLYKSGVFTGSCGSNLDHGVLLVGYTEDAYILKNSWSSSWGDNGYIYLAKGNDLSTGKPYNNGNGQCGVLMEGVYPNL